MGHAAKYWDICRANNLLYVFLYSGDGENTGHGGELEEIRRVHTRHQTRTANGGIYRPSANAVSNGGFIVSGVYSGVTQFNRRRNAYTRGLFWRNGVIDSGKRSVAYDEADRSNGRNEAL